MQGGYTHSVDSSASDDFSSCQWHSQILISCSKIDSKLPLDLPNPTFRSTFLVFPTFQWIGLISVLLLSIKYLLNILKDKGLDFNPKHKTNLSSHHRKKKPYQNTSHMSDHLHCSTHMEGVCEEAILLRLETLAILTCGRTHSVMTKLIVLCAGRITRYKILW